MEGRSRGRRTDTAGRVLKEHRLMTGGGDGGMKKQTVALGRLIEKMEVKERKRTHEDCFTVSGEF